MKKYLLLFLMCVCASIGAWAQATFDDDYKGAYITTNGAGNLTTSAIESNASHFQWVNYVIITGNINNSDVANLASASYTIDGNNSGGSTIDFSGAVGDVTFTAKSAFKGIKLPTGYDLASYSGPQTFAFYVDGSDVYLRILDADNGLEDVRKLSVSFSWANAPLSGKTVYLSGNYGDFETARAFLKDANNASATEVIKVAPISNDPYTVSGCNVIINMAKAEAGKTFAQVVAEAKAAMTAADATQTNICSLTVQYAGMTNADLAVLGDADVAGATRIDLSGVTLASGASIDNIQLPSSLQQLVLPEDQTVSGTLATKLAAVTNLWYAYSPSSDSQKPAASSTASFDETRNLIADYVWVNKAGGLAQAFINEAQLRNSYYIKVASNVALNDTDVNFNGLGGNKPTNYLFLDFSASNLTSTVAALYTVTDDIGYRIILPNNWDVDDMSVFAANTNMGSLAAVYSYSGTTLKIMEIRDNDYSTTALKNPRIVRSGTTAIEVVGKIEQVSDNWVQYGDLGNNLIAALNQADDAPNDNTVNNIKTININVGQAYTILTEIDFTNTNIEHFVMSGVKNKNNDATGAGIDVSGCTNLQTIDVSNSTLQLLDAHGLTSLTSVDMSGTLMTNANGLSGETILTGCTSLTTSGFVTNSSTEFKKDLKLINTGLTSFSTAAKVGGNIYLNASTGITSVDLTSTQFQNTTSIVHIDKTAGETTDAIDNLSRTEGDPAVAVKTIMVPNGFTSSTRIHPYTEVENNIQEQASQGAGTADADNCYISYDGTTKTATVYTNTAGHLANILATDYASYPAGTTFKFASTSVINENDLKALTGYITKTDNTTTDMNWRTNYYYVDMYDLTATNALCGETGVIGNTITWLRTNNRQFKGLILPKDQTSHGYGTTLIKDAENADPAQATCSEFIAYYTTGTSATGDEQLVAHIYNESNTNTAAYQASFDKMKSMLATEVTTDADLYLISTNSQSKIDISSLPTDKTRIETINNEMVGTQTGKASIYVYPDNSGAIKTSVDNTAIESTPTELLQVNGAMNPDDFTALNNFTDGPRVLDLRNVTSPITKTMLESLTNTTIEYILLPESMANKTEVCTPDYSDLTGLKAVIASTSTDLVAYVKQAGSLAEARYLATGGSVSVNNLYSPDKVGLTNVTLTGELKAADIGCNLNNYGIDANGHWTTTTGALASVGLSQEIGITSMDLEDAVFVNKVEAKDGNTVTSYADMNFSWAGLANLSDIKLPTSTEMKDIPESCCEGLASLKEICIPQNYEKIHNAAFLNTIVEHITTTDAKGTLVDNGPNTYTLSANLKQVGDAPADNTVGLTATQTVFPQNRPVFDCYVLATRTPICYKNAFPANMLYGWGGFDGTLPYCRDKYVNGTNYYCVLRFPSQESYNAVTNADKKDTSYDLMKKQYTDVTKVYSKMEQTGAVDANGDAITWPTFSELRRAYNQATAGITWNNWVANYDGQQEVNGGDNIPTEATGLTLGHYNSTNGTANNDLGDYTFANYEGWHQFTLSQATYVEPDETPSETREYEDAGWFTFCIPYDMTVGQVIEMMGIPASAGNVTNELDGAKVTEDKMPDIRQLRSVQRTQGNATTPNKVIFRLTTNLYRDGGSDVDIKYLTFHQNPVGTADVITETSTVNQSGSMPELKERRCLVGGIPYIIKAYKRKDITIKSRNLGNYVMTRYGDQFKVTASCIYSGNYEYLGSLDTDVEDQLVTLKFARPFENHKIQAASDVDNETGWATYMDGTKERKYYYTLVGQFWEQKLPQYCFYMSGKSWYRNSTTNNYKWSPYKCVIMATPYISYTTPSGRNGGGYRLNSGAQGTLTEGYSFYPSIEANTEDKLNGTLKIVFADGRDDDDFQTSNGAKKYMFAFDDFITEYDENGNETTAIDKLDGEELPSIYDDDKVYNMAGQYVGKSLDSLPKGIYIMNGKKFIVK